MRRCCPDSCNTGNFTEEDCNRFQGLGNCIYPNDAQCHTEGIFIVNMALSDNFCQTLIPKRCIDYSWFIKFYSLGSVPSTCYVTGDGIGGTEKGLGIAATREDCVTMVKTREPTANGATFPNKDGQGSCYAEFGMTAVNPTPSWQTCQFDSKLKTDSLFIHYYIWIRLYPIYAFS